jgi:hypothetical protein
MSRGFLREGSNSYRLHQVSVPLFGIRYPGKYMGFYPPMKWIIAFSLMDSGIDIENIIFGVDIGNMNLLTNKSQLM